MAAARRNKQQRRAARATGRGDRKATPVRGKATAGRRTTSRKKARRRGLKDPTSGARSSLRNFRQATILAVVFTGFLMLMLDAFGAQVDVASGRPDTVAVIEEFDLEELLSEEEQEEQDAADADLSETAGDAWAAVQDMYRGFMRLLPRFLIAAVILVLIWLLVKGVNALINKALGHWERTEAITTLVAIVLWLVGVGLVLSIIVGDVRALIGSLGLVGLALSWALQSPIESGTGWLLNKFKGYYRVGDRIVVGDVFGDVYKIDFINTTLWEIGDPFSGGFVNAEQPTGRLVIFPNSEILNGIVVNLTADYPYVWDELAVQVANESDIDYCIKVISKIAHELLEEQMKEPAAAYERILRKEKLEQQVSAKPQIFLSLQDSWTDVSVRYLIPARERRKWKSELVRLLTVELNRAEHDGRIVPVYPRTQVQLLDRSGIPAAFRNDA